MDRETKEVATATETAPAIYEPEKRGLQTTGETAASATAAHARAMVEARYVIALRSPRDMDTVRQRLIHECNRPSFADVARYRKPIGQGVEGLSIRFVEAAIRCMTNIAVKTLTSYDDAEKRIVNVSVGDLETNTWYDQDATITKTVERKRAQDGDDVLGTRMNSKNERIYIIRADDDSILNKQNAIISKAIRTQGLRLIPGDLQDECEARIIKTKRDRDAKDPDAARNAVFDALASVGVTAPMVKDFLGHEGERLTPKELDELRLFFVALRDGETDWREIMDARAPKKDSEGETAGQQSAAEALKRRLEEKRKPAEGATDKKEEAKAAEAKKEEPKKDDAVDGSLFKKKKAEE